MIGKMIGAFVGDRLAKQTNAVGGATGAALGVVATTLVRRLSIPAMITLGAGGYLAKKFLDKQEGKPANAEADNTPPRTSTAPATS